MWRRRKEAEKIWKEAELFVEHCFQVSYFVVCFPFKGMTSLSIGSSLIMVAKSASWEAGSWS